ncbi:MAG: DUF1330 domain-containing protein [Actinobacteria bacterium]|nr:DUF1330 domain-containing protein [Actinomycetota bacterium]
MFDEDQVGLRRPAKSHRRTKGDELPAYLVAGVVGVKGAEALRAHLDASPRAHPRTGRGRYVTRGGTVEVLDGEFAAKRVTVVEFPTMEGTLAWYRSPRYAAIRPIRLQNSEASMVLLDGLPT